ncbi:MAG TPA: ATP-binding protein [bacterium]|nr:ATP-binding protein [bacterium]
MLIQYHVENFLSINQEAGLNLIASDKIKDHLGHIYKKENGKKISLVRAAALYGANAAGKSNLITSIFHAKNFIIEGKDFFSSVSSNWFKLDPECKTKPTTFEFIIKIKNEIYTYGFVIDRNRVLEEWLYSIPKTREVMLFVRKTSESKGVSVEIGPQLAEKNSEDWKYLKNYVARGTHEQCLFLTESTKIKDKKFEKLNIALDWFDKTLLVIPPNAPFRSLPWKLANEPSFKTFFNDFITNADTGISKVEVVEEPFDFEKFTSLLPEEERNKMVRQLRSPNNENLIAIGKGNQIKNIIKKDDGFYSLEIKTRHGDNKNVQFGAADESDGTFRLMNLTPVLYAEKDRDRVYVLDELERSMHPLLSRFMVKYFLDNKSLKRSQIVFSTHESNLLDLDLLRRDEIFFVEKDAEQQTRMYSLSDFNIRKDLSIRKGYLMGRFGAVPFFGDIGKLFKE